MQKLYELVLENLSKPVYNVPEQRGIRTKSYLYRFPREICKEIKKEVFSI